MIAKVLWLKDTRAIPYHEAGVRESSRSIQVAIAFMLKFGPFPEDGSPSKLRRFFADDLGDASVVVKLLTVGVTKQS